MISLGGCLKTGPKLAVTCKEENKENKNMMGCVQGNLSWWPSCCHVWRRVIVPPDFLVTKPSKEFCYACVAFLAWTQLCMHLSYHAVKHAATIMRADYTK